MVATTYVSAAIALVAVVLASSFHAVPQGYVGVYWRFGSLQSTVTEPGLQFHLPFVVAWEPIQVTVQTDAVLTIPCGSKGGTMMSFERIEVVNRLQKAHVIEVLTEFGTHYDKTLIYDKVHHEVNQFCSKNSLQDIYQNRFDEIDEILQAALQKGVDTHTRGIEIISVRVTKPTIPKQVEQNYVAFEEKRTALMVAEQRRHLVQFEAETETLRRVKEAEMLLNVARMEAQRKIEEATAQANQTRILAEAEAYRSKQQAEANEKLLTPAYIQATVARSLANQTKAVYFGENSMGMLSAVADRVLS